MKIVNNVTKLKTISTDDFLALDFNKLKDPKRDVTKLVNAIKKDGWNFPIYVWEQGNYVIDGTGRRMALEILISDGYIINEIPVVYIKATTLEEAKVKTLQASSQFGLITDDTYDIFIEDLNLDFDTFNFNIDSVGNSAFLEEINKGDENSEWVGMPDFEPQQDDYKIIIAFDTEERRDDFVKKYKMEFTSKNKNTWSTRIPFQERDNLAGEIYE